MVFAIHSTPMGEGGGGAPALAQKGCLPLFTYCKQTMMKQKILEMPVVEQVKRSFHKKNRIAMMCGAVLGGFVPAATYVIGHFETGAQPVMWCLVAGGLIYSAKSVYDFGRSAFKHPAKALGFVVLAEGVMTFSATPALSLASLALLVAINAIAAGINLALDAK